VVTGCWDEAGGAEGTRETLLALLLPVAVAGRGRGWTAAEMDIRRVGFGARLKTWMIDFEIGDALRKTGRHGRDAWRSR